MSPPSPRAGGPQQGGRDSFCVVPDCSWALVGTHRRDRGAPCAEAACLLLPWPLSPDHGPTPCSLLQVGSA